MEFHFATVWESVADVAAERTALVHGERRFTWREFDERAARLAGALHASGLGPDSKVGLYLFNGNEYLEANYAAMKLRGVPVNVNYRYLEEELVYLLDNADAEALIFHSSLADRVAKIRHRLPGLRLLVEVDDTGPGGAGGVDDAVPYEDLLAAHDPMPRIERSEDDIYMLYTGGTTGMPKGVMYRHGDATLGFSTSALPLIGMAPTTSAEQIAPMVSEALASGFGVVSMPCAPLMHGTGLWLGAMIPHVVGATVVTLQSRSLDPHEVLATAQAEAVSNLVIVGDSFAKPLIGAIDEAAADGRPYDLSRIARIVSSGVMWTSEVKAQLIERIEQAMLVDGIGSTEGSMGLNVTMKGAPSETAKFTRNPTTKVFADDGREVQPGSGEIGMVAAGGIFVPVGYFKDPEKSARTFRTVDGQRYSFPGDMAMIAEDGSLILLGRGSQVINSGGEKIFPEEVEEATKRVPGVIDCLVVGTDDERFGQAVTAVVSLDGDADVDEAAIISGVKQQLAGYKAPRRVVFVATVPRAPNGKADYPTARELAIAALTAS